MADFSVAAVFSDHCVLQRNKNICIFGTAAEGSSISVEISNSKSQVISKNTAATYGSRWEVILPALPAQNDCTMKVSCSTGDSKTFTDISIGEVWLAGGQSNMEFELQNCTEGPDELQNEKNPNVRFYYTNKIGWMDEAFYEAEKNTSWQTWDSEWKKSWSAVGYFFAKKLAADLGVTVGVIGCNWGGTSASAWMDKAHLERDLDMKTYLDEQEEATKGKSIEQQCTEYDAYVKENDIWQQKCNELYATVPGIEWNEIQEKIGNCPWPGPKSCKNPYRPTGLYECMLKRIMPYTLKGFIWYQGESDDHKPHTYYKLFSTMIDQWRTDWKDDSLPFIFVQLPGNRYKQDKDFKHWCLIREAQAKVHSTIKNTAMVCGGELGQYNDIHPRHKKVLAERMENAALYTAYGQKTAQEVLSPMYKSAITCGNIITLQFENASTGFTVKADDEALKNYKYMEELQGNTFPEDFTGFEVAGADGVYYPAQFAFGGNDSALNTISLHSPKVEQPVYARYAWYNYGPVTIFGKNGLPLSPFRTSQNDSQNQKVEHAEIQQIMTTSGEN